MRKDSNNEEAKARMHEERRSEGREDAVLGTLLEEAWSTVTRAFEEHLSGFGPGSLEARGISLYERGPRNGTLRVEASLELPGAHHALGFQWFVPLDYVLAAEPAGVARRFLREAHSDPENPAGPEEVGEGLAFAAVGSLAPPPTDPREN